MTMLTAGIEPASPRDLDAITALLVASQLPIEGLAAHLANVLVVRDGTGIVGVAALEVYAGGALLRSVAVDERVRGRGVGQRLVEAALARARQLGVPAVFLLTDTAAAFYPRFGFARISRDDVPEDVKESVEFASLCPASATVMRLRLA
jgi:amino-acid N-acetyltransferase